ncbi:hypothetical protein JCM9140_3678 [Halalkalibacter wakoensis JCM 9140]|uniref:PRTase associated wHTH domain-containing protein n=2 Tax=Halalkalibacter wakoensis TaxID=127891 RepID=W4Q631_9BACI|nr:hypothetical protein JCM9140_3678 [Halalkalibacter wakoensis JCM 9140]
MIAYKVLVPYPEDKALNLFQETILKLYQSGRKTAEYISNKLLIHEELVSFIIKELIERQLLTTEGLLTESGQAILSELQEPYNMKTGYIFYDVINKSYWDTFIFDEEFQYVSCGHGHDKRRFEYGDVGNPRKQLAVVIKSDLSEYPEDPTNIEILTVCIKHKRRMKTLEQGGYLPEGGINRLPKNLGKVKFLGEKFPVYTATFLFMPNDLNNKSFWQVCHPFKGGTSQMLRENLDQLKEASNQSFLKEEISDIVNEAFRVSQIEIDGLEDDKNKEASSFLKDVLSEQITSYPSVYKKLLDLYHVVKELNHLHADSNRGKTYEEIQTKMREYIRTSHETLEDALLIVKQANDDYFNHRYLTKDAYKNGEILSVFAEQCGFKNHETNPLIQRFLSVKKGSVLYAGESKELSSLVAVHLLMAKEISEHPFWKLGEKIPQLLLFFSHLKTKRNKSSHSSGVEFHFKNEEMLFAKVMYVISMLLSNLDFHYEKDFTFQPSEEDERSIDQKLYYFAENEIYKKVGTVVQAFPQIQSLLVDVEYSKLKKKNSFLVEATRVMEELLTALGKKTVIEEARMHVQKKATDNLSYLRKPIQLLGFEFEIEQLPDSFINVNPNKIINSFRDFENSVLSAKLYAILFSVTMKETELIKELARDIPQFIQLAVKISDQRGHGNVTVTEEVRQEISQQLYEVVIKLLPIYKKYQVG